MKSDFYINCEADCERVAAVIIQWYKNESYDLVKQEHSVRVPNERWAACFASIFADEVERNNLEHEATDLPCSLLFSCEEIHDNKIMDALEMMNDEEIMEAIDEYLRDMTEDEDDDEEEDEDNNDA